MDYEEIRGHAAEKRGLIIAATGQHSVLFVGPAACGTDKLISAFPTILPEGDDWTPEFTSTTTCPCGAYGRRGANCECTPRKLDNWQKQLAHLADGADMLIEVAPEYERERFSTKGRPSADMAAEVRHGRRFAEIGEHPTEPRGGARNLLEYGAAIRSLDHAKAARIARTIAYLERSEEICEEHIAEAFYYQL